MKMITRFMEMDADKITRPMIIDFRDENYHRGGSCNSALDILRMILRFGYDRGLCNHNHAASMKGVPILKHHARWTDEEIEAFLKVATPEARAILMMALYTGQRQSDLYRMSWAQYDGTGFRLHQMKTRRVLFIPVHPELKKELEKLWERRKPVNPVPYILTTSTGCPWTRVYMREMVAKTLKKAGITGKSLHGLRKTTAAKLAEIGCPPHLIGSITGHTTLKEIMAYTAEADQVRMAKDAMNKWVENGPVYRDNNSDNVGVL
jgi:integrase